MTPSAVVHTSDLVERHAITFPASPDGDADLRRRVWDAATKLAQDWALEHDLEVDISVFEDVDEEGVPRRWGAKWSVVIGTGTLPLYADEDDDPSRWTWSGRWRAWLTTFRRMDRPRLQVVPRDKVLPIRGRG